MKGLVHSIMLSIAVMERKRIPAFSQFIRVWWNANCLFRYLNMARWVCSVQKQFSVITKTPVFLAGAGTYLFTKGYSQYIPSASDWVVKNRLRKVCVMYMQRLHCFCNIHTLWWWLKIRQKVHGNWFIMEYLLTNSC